MTLNLNQLSWIWPEGDILHLSEKNVSPKEVTQHDLGVWFKFWRLLLVFIMTQQCYDLCRSCVMWNLRRINSLPPYPQCKWYDLLSRREEKKAIHAACVRLCTLAPSHSCFSLVVVFLHQLLKPDEDSTSTQRYIDSRTVQPRAKGSWISVDVTETIKDWVSDPGQPQHQADRSPIMIHRSCVCIVHLSCLFLFLLLQRIILAWSLVSTVPAAPSSHPPTTSFPTRVRSWRLCLLVCCRSFCFHCTSCKPTRGTRTVHVHAWWMIRGGFFIRLRWCPVTLNLKLNLHFWLREDFHTSSPRKVSELSWTFCCREAVSCQR